MGRSRPGPGSVSGHSNYSRPGPRSMQPPIASSNRFNGFYQDDDRRSMKSFYSETEKVHYCLLSEKTVE